MIRQCFFPTSYRRRSKNAIKPQIVVDTSITRSFVKRLDLSCRRPVRSEKHLSSYTENQNETITQTDIFQLKRNCEFSYRLNQSKKKGDEALKHRLAVLPEKKQLSHTKQLKRRTTQHFGMSRTRRVGITEIKNQDWNWNHNLKPQKAYKINMTERIKTAKCKQLQNVIVGWDYEEDTDTFF